MLKKILFLSGLLVAIGVSVYAFLSPSSDFKSIQKAVITNDIDAFSSQLDMDQIRKHLRNQMSLRMQYGLRDRRTASDSATEARLSSYFDMRIAAFASPASLLNELGSQLKAKRGDVVLEFIGLSTARASWYSEDEIHYALLSRRGMTWKLSALDFPDAMPRFWNQPTRLIGEYHQKRFANCCFNGDEIETPYHELRLRTMIDILDMDANTTSGTEWITAKISEVQIGVEDTKMVAGIKDGDLVSVNCTELWPGNTGHYALGVYCKGPIVRSLR